MLPGGVTLDHGGTVVCLLPEELIEHPVLAELLDPLLALAALVAAALPGREGGGQREEGEEGEAEESEPHGVSAQVTPDQVRPVTELRAEGELVCEQGPP